MKTRFAIIAACTLSATIAVADTVDAQYIQLGGGNGNASRLQVGGSTYLAGHMVHEYTSGARSGEQFSTFCIDFNETANTSEGASYQIVDVADAPMPGVPYGQVVADKISAVVANAAALGWIDSRLQADTNQADYAAKMGAIQAAIWEAFGSPINLTNENTSDGLSDYYAILTNPATYNEDLRLAGLMAMVADNQQDMLYVVPLPPAVFAGAGLLMGIAGVRSVRRRRNR